MSHAPREPERCPACGHVGSAMVPHVAAFPALNQRPPDHYLRQQWYEEALTRRQQRIVNHLGRVDWVMS